MGDKIHGDTRVQAYTVIHVKITYVFKSINTITRKKRSSGHVHTFV